DLDLRFTPDETLVGFLGLLAPAGSRLPADPNSPNIFAALEGQLGLKLVPAKGPVEVLVIDHAEIPTEN
ncbi:MAG TPA: TIGR03435 family protein, partial [Bryobacteraceae bacterium]|nr:TIGR03435 family protein [Bryobacteraceae bacterium]